jgi:hypothetical protein
MSRDEKTPPAPRPAPAPASPRDDPRGASEADYYVDELGRYVFTRAFHRRRGYCCESGCRHCPWDFPLKKP